MENNIKNSEDFLKSVIKKNTGLSAPKNYFENAEDKFSAFLKEEKFPKENGFSIPNNYFDALEDSILNKVNTPKKGKVISLKDRIIKFIPVAAAACVALFLSINFYNNFKTDEINFDSLAEVDIENWVIENASDISDEDFATLIHNEVNNENDFAFASLNNTDIENYIIDSDNTSLLNENY
ncbi:hypothetical protein [Polaribacter sp. OB-PA-B3]